MQVGCAVLFSCFGAVLINCLNFKGEGFSRFDS
jgi:hypothetical protein